MIGLNADFVASEYTLANTRLTASDISCSVGGRVNICCWCWACWLLIAGDDEGEIGDVERAEPFSSVDRTASGDVDGGCFVEWFPCGEDVWGLLLFVSSSSTSSSSFPFLPL